MPGLSRTHLDRPPCLPCFRIPHFCFLLSQFLLWPCGLCQRAAHGLNPSAFPLSSFPPVLGPGRPSRTVSHSNITMSTDKLCILAGGPPSRRPNVRLLPSSCHFILYNLYFILFPLPPPPFQILKSQIGDAPGCAAGQGGTGFQPVTSPSPDNPPPARHPLLAFGYWLFWPPSPGLFPVGRP